MKLFAIDTSSQSASCAIVDDGVLLGEFFTNIALTHSQTILPMVQNLLEQTRLTLADIDVFATTVGPGSFTGLRIGISAVKGMSHALSMPCVAVSTLEALAYAYNGTDSIVAPVLDARCSQVYTALFRWDGDTFTRLSQDEAIPITELELRLKNLDNHIFLVGDGASLCYNKLHNNVPGLILSSPALRYTRASCVALAGMCAYGEGRFLAPEDLSPAYLRLPQAQRELLAKK